mgnify:CR=1 FL=1
MREEIRNYFENNENIVSVKEKNGRIFVIVKDSGLVSMEEIEKFPQIRSVQMIRNRIIIETKENNMAADYKQISTQNKINFIDGLKGLSECVVYGLYVLFNSTMYDSYYRILNGSTQVNSTEVNSMPVPPMSTIESMGKELIAKRDMSEESCDMILRSYL